MIRVPPRDKRTDPRVPDTTLCRAGAPPTTDGPRIAVHGHFFYPEAVDEFLERLARTGLKPRVVLTTDEEAKAARLRAALHAAGREGDVVVTPNAGRDIRSEEHTSELPSLMRSSYAVFCLKKK